MARVPNPPARENPTGWEHYPLWLKVREALLALPAYFNTPTNIEGILATDIHTLNQVLGATIEEQVVDTLNAMRSVWDADKAYQLHRFVRQAQIFPDVLLRMQDDGEETLLGIELKGWYLLNKEGMPNFRFLVSPDACNPWDLIVVVPWSLSNVLAGTPVVYTPFVGLARFAARQRNYYWQYERSTTGDATIICAEGVSPYPQKSGPINDKASSDSGGNFGRLARYGIMNEYKRSMMAATIRGVSARDWHNFFKKCREQ